MKYIKRINEDFDKNSIESKMAKELLNISGDDATYKVKVIDKRPGKKANKNIIVKFDNDGDPIIKDDVLSEGIKDKFMVGVVCTILASGLVSCKKESGPKFGYNISVAPTTYTISPNGNKEIEVFRDGSLQKIKVDSTTEKTYSFGGNGLLFNRRITPTEFYIIGAGKEYEKEISNNRSNDVVTDVKSGNISLSGGDGTQLYQSGAGESTGSPRDHKLWNIGIDALNKKGENTSALISKADKEVANGIWDDANGSKNEKDFSKLATNPLTLDSSNYMGLFKSATGIPEWQVASGKLGGSDAVRLSKTFGDTRFKEFGVWQTANKQLENEVWLERAKITVTSTEKNSLKIYGTGISDLLYKNGYWEYNNGTKTYRLKLVWDGKSLTMFENNEKLATFSR